MVIAKSFLTALVYSTDQMNALCTVCNGILEKPGQIENLSDSDILLQVLIESLFYL